MKTSIPYRNYEKNLLDTLNFVCVVHLITNLSVDMPGQPTHTVTDVISSCSRIKSCTALPSPALPEKVASSLWVAVKRPCLPDLHRYGVNGSEAEACSAKHPCVHEIRMSTFDSCCQAVTVKQIMSVGGNCNISLSR